MKNTTSEKVFFGFLRSIIMVGTRDSENGMCLVRSTSRVALKEYAGGLVSAPAYSVQLFYAFAG